MNVIWGALILLLSVPCWGGQVVSWLWPRSAERWKLTEAADSVEPAYYGDIRGEAVWDALTLWIMPVVGVLLIVGSDAWAILGLMAGATYTYFGGRGIFTRRAIQERGFRIGSPDNVATAYAALVIWGALGLAVIGASIVSV